MIGFFLCRRRDRRVVVASGDDDPFDSTFNELSATTTYEKGDDLK